MKKFDITRKLRSFRQGKGPIGRDEIVSSSWSVEPIYPTTPLGVGSKAVGEIKNRTWDEIFQEYFEKAGMVDMVDRVSILGWPHFILQYIHLYLSNRDVSQHDGVRLLNYLVNPMSFSEGEEVSEERWEYYKGLVERNLGHLFLKEIEWDVSLFHDSENFLGNPPAQFDEFLLSFLPYTLLLFLSFMRWPKLPTENEIREAYNILLEEAMRYEMEMYEMYKTDETEEQTDETKKRRNKPKERW